jgi:hypothetical protein
MIKEEDDTVVVSSFIEEIRSEPESEESVESVAEESVAEESVVQEEKDEEIQKGK